MGAAFQAGSDRECNLYDPPGLFIERTTFVALLRKLFEGIPDAGVLLLECCSAFWWQWHALTSANLELYFRGGLRFRAINPTFRSFPFPSARPTLTLMHSSAQSVIEHEMESIYRLY